MAWAAVGTFISQANKTAGVSTSYTVEVATSVGDVLILIIAKDNANTGDGDFSEVKGVTDSGRNPWSKLAEFTNGQGAADAGATVSVWYTRSVVALSTSSTVTVELSDSRTAKAVTGHRFTIATNKAISTGAAPSTLANDAADAGSMTISSLANQEWLFLRAIAVELNLTTFTATTNYTAFDITGANTAGSAATNQAARGEFRIVTATTETSDPTTAVADQASLFMALQETTPPAISPAFYPNIHVEPQQCASYGHVAGRRRL